MSYFQLQTVKGANFIDKFLLNQVENMSFLNDTLNVRFKNGTSERYSVTEEVSEKIMTNWETWCAEQSSQGVSQLLEASIGDMGKSFQEILSQVDKEFKTALINRTDETLGHVDELFRKLAPRYHALEQIAATFEKYLGQGAPK